MPGVKFSPVQPENQKLAAMKFNLIIKLLDTDLCYSGVGNNCKSPSNITMGLTGDGAFLFNTVSILMTGKDMYSATIRHIVCNYISNPVKYSSLTMYIQNAQYKSGQ